MASKKNKKTIKKNIFNNPIFYFFLILLAGITNARYGSVLDKELEPRVFSIAVFLFALIAIPLLTMKKPWSTINIKTIKNPFTYFYIGFIAINGISIIKAGNTPEAIHELLKLCTFFTLYIYLVLIIIPKENSKQLFLKSFIIFSLIASIVGIIQAIKIFSENGFSIEVAYLIKGNFSHKNMFSQILFLSFTFAAYSIFEFKDIWRKVAFIGASTNLILIIALMTRSVWVALFVASITGFILFYFYIRKNYKGKMFTRPVIYTLSGIIGAGIIALILFSQLDNDSTIKKHVLEATDFKSGNTYHRLHIWKKSIPIIKENPILGVGAGNWKIEILKHDVVLYTNGWIVPRRTHNDYISVTTETGFLGLFVFLGMFFSLIYYGIKLIKKQSDKQDKLFTLTLLYALIGYMTFSFFSFTKERIETQILLNTIFAFIVYKYYELKENKTPIGIKPTLTKAIAFILLVGISFTGYSAHKRIKAETAMNKFYGLAKRKADAKQLYGYVKGIRSPFVSLTPMSSPFSLLEANVMLQLKQNRKKVIAKTLEALSDCPTHPKTMVQLAYLYSQEKDYENMLKYSELAYKYAPSNIRVISAYATYLDKVEKLDEAYKIVSKNPNYHDKQFKSILTRILLEKLITLQKEAENETIKYTIAELSKNRNELINLQKRALRDDVLFEKIVFQKVVHKIWVKDQNTAKNLSSPLFKKYEIDRKKQNKKGWNI